MPLTITAWNIYLYTKIGQARFQEESEGLPHEKNVAFLNRMRQQIGWQNIIPRTPPYGKLLIGVYTF